MGKNISYHGHTKLVEAKEGRMTANRYIEDVLEPNVVPYAPFISNDFLLMCDKSQINDQKKSQ